MAILWTVINYLVYGALIRYLYRNKLRPMLIHSYEVAQAQVLAIQTTKKQLDARDLALKAQEAFAHDYYQNMEDRVAHWSLANKKQEAVKQEWVGKIEAQMRERAKKIALMSCAAEETRLILVTACRGAQNDLLATYRNSEQVARYQKQVMGFLRQDIKG